MADEDIQPLVVDNGTGMVKVSLSVFKECLIGDMEIENCGIYILCEILAGWFCW